MFRSAASKVMWVGRATVFLVGLAVILALMFGVASSAFAHGGNEGFFHLGHRNVTSSVSTLIKRGAGPALKLRVGSGPPLKVNSSSKVNNLNSDQIDGKSEDDFYAAGSKVADSDQIDGTDSSNLIKRGNSGSATPLGMNFYSYFMNTTSGVNNYLFGQARLQTTGTAGQFRVCGNSSAIGSFNYVAYVNGTRTAGTVPTNGCSSAFDAGAGGDFQVTIRRAQIFGVHSGDSTTNENYNLYGFSQL